MSAKLTKCHQCEGAVSIAARTCPHCGHPLKLSYMDRVERAQRIMAWVVGVVFAFLLFIYVLGTFAGG